MDMTSYNQSHDVSNESHNQSHDTSHNTSLEARDLTLRDGLTLRDASHALPNSDTNDYLKRAITDLRATTETGLRAATETGMCIYELPLKQEYETLARAINKALTPKLSRG